MFIEKKKNNFFMDLIFIFEIKKFYNFENYSKKNLILKLKNKFFVKNNFLKLDLIGCGAYHSIIFNNSFIFIFIYFIYFF
jgi:hypothetical protein